MNTSVIKTTCPPDSQLQSFLLKSDFEDAYAFPIPEGHEEMEEIYKKIFYTTPKWVMYALRLRNLLVSPFGLKTEMKKNLSPSFKVGEKVGIFTISPDHRK